MKSERVQKMMILPMSLLLLAGLWPHQAGSQEAAKAVKAPAAAPIVISDKLAADIARTQRDLLLADARMKDAVERYNAAKAGGEALNKALSERLAEAGKACGEKLAFDAGKLACVEKLASQK